MRVVIFDPSKADRSRFHDAYELAALPYSDGSITSLADSVGVEQQENFKSS